ncbi:hypothetical protein BDZ97DRAFT_1672053 [Flammula alnicola]|nr:hypothetical protein BDZ97DRAFT_1672053 [Flammula alnicola]
MSEGLGDPQFFQRKKLRKGTHFVDTPYSRQSPFSFLHLDLRKHIDSLCPAYSPSETIGSITKIRELLEGVNTRVYLGRPGGAPAAIFNPALAALQRRLDHLDQVQVTCQDVTHATDYLNLAMKIYDNETARESAIQESVDAAVGLDGGWNVELNWADDIEPDCCWWHEGFLIMVLELKNVVGLDGNPLLQAIVDYGKIISQEKYRHFQEFCNFPTVLVGVAENRIDISIAVCVGEIHVTKLLTLDVTAGFFASDNIVRLARVFKALSCCQKDLALYYGEVRQKTTPPLSSLFPKPTPVDPSIVLPALTYKQFLTQAGQPTSVLVGLGDKRHTAMYIAALDSTENDVIVKFTARYNEKAHRILASAGFAPKLHFCGRVVGGLYMVVMDRVDGKSLWQLQIDEKPIPAVVSEHVRQAVCLLHEQNIVFGDLRAPNILYEVSKSCAVIVDFDWPGMHQVDRYPATLNPANNWPEDVVPYGLMLKSHDLWQLERLEGLCKPDA